MRRGGGDVKDEPTQPRRGADAPAVGEMTEGAPPRSFEDLRKRFFGEAWTWLARKPRWVQALALAAIVASGLGLARLHFLGDTAYQQARRLMPRHLPIVDPARVTIPLELVLEVEVGGSFKRVFPDDVLRTGDRVQLTVSAGADSQVMLLCVDSAGVHAVPELLAADLEPIAVDAGYSSSVSFLLDDTEGPEHYYAVARSQPFSIRDVEKAISKLFPDGRAKGPLTDAGRLPLPAEFAQRHVRFMHLSPGE